MLRSLFVVGCAIASVHVAAAQTRPADVPERDRDVVSDREVDPDVAEPVREHVVEFGTGDTLPATAPPAERDYPTPDRPTPDRPTPVRPPRPERPEAPTDPDTAARGALTPQSGVLPPRRRDVPDDPRRRER